MMQAIRWVVSFAVLGWMVSISAAQEQGKNAPVPSSNTPSGAELYSHHCAACHGDDLKGNGPFPSPYRTPPDLTKLVGRHGGKFPEVYVMRVLRSGVTLPAHGPAEMPVWGTEFAATDRLSKTQVELRIKNLTNYIKSHQAK